MNIRTYFPEKHKDLWKSRIYAAAYKNHNAELLFKALEPLTTPVKLMVERINGKR